MLPAPSDPRKLRPTLVTLAADRWLARVHRRGVSAAQFNPGLGRGRFHPIFAADGRPVPTLYAAQTLQAALVETLFRLTPQGANPKRLYRRYLQGYEYSWIAVRRPLTLVDLRGVALRALNVARADLLDSSAQAYPQTALWGQALHRAAPKAQGLVWRSRQLDTADVFVLFGYRVGAADLQVDDDSWPLHESRGWERVLQLAQQMGVVVTDM